MTNQDIYAPTMMISPWAKVQQQNDAVHHTVAQCDQCIDAAKGQAIDQLAKKNTVMDGYFLSLQRLHAF